MDRKVELDVCSAGSRVLAQRPVYDDVVQRLAERARAIRVGDPGTPATTMGPVISAAQWLDLEP